MCVKIILPHVHPIEMSYSASRCECNFIDYVLKGSISFDLDVVWNTGSKT